MGERRRVRVLCIAGTGQNGATLLTRALGRLPGFAAVGELGRLWDKGLLDDQSCGCLEPFSACPFWTEAGEAGFGGWDRVDGYEVARLREEVRLRRALPSDSRPPIPQVRQRAPSRLPWLAARTAGHRARMRGYADVMGRLYRGIDEVAGGAVIVDSMKVPYHIDVVRRIPDVDLSVLHLVRDSRGVAYSNLKWVPKQSPSGGKAYRGRRSPAKAALRWAQVNASFDVLAARGVRTARARYERVVASPREELRRIAAFAGVRVGDDDLAFVGDAAIELVPDHLVAGNRMRLESGTVALRADEAWREGLGERERRLVTALTWPLLRRYGYTGSSRASAGSARDR